MYVINRAAMESNTYKGSEHGPASISIIFSDSEPGEGPKLHKHPYDETWIVQEGRVQMWIGDETIEAKAGDIGVAPPDTPHKFKNIGDGVAKLICIHSSPTAIGEWLE